MDILALLVLLAPLCGFVAVGVGFRYVTPWAAQVITCGFMLVGAISSAFLAKDVCFFGQTLTFSFLPFLSTSSLDLSWGVQLDALSALMMVVISMVSLMVHLYAVGYMQGDKSIPRFMAYLSFFTFCMLLLVTAPHLVQLFVGWEGVGLCSYLLIGYYYDRESAARAAMKAFIVNRIGDVGFLLATCLIFSLFQSFTFEDIFRQVPGILSHQTDLPFFGPVASISLICALFFVGAMGKSAQLGLHVWLPDAMEAPTPVSALIHAATMVTAGVFLMVRLSPLLEYAPYVQGVILLLGACTAFFAATVACTQTDIKRVIAYSTCSQLGYMFMAVGISAYGAAMFHLTTHAFFKALLFLGAGSVIHALSGGQDMREMGGIARLVPFTYAAMWIGSLALAGLPFFSGYYSKDAILEALWKVGSPQSLIALSLALVVVCLTAFYSWRLLLLVFHGPSRANAMVLSHVHESPPLLLFPLTVLGMGAIFLGFLAYGPFLGPDPMWGRSLFLLPDHQALLSHHPQLPFWALQLPLLLSLLGIGLAFLLYQNKNTLSNILNKKHGKFYNFFVQKWYIDALYEGLFVKPLWKFAHFLWHTGDVKGIDRFGPHGVALMVSWVSKKVSLSQTGYLYHYAFAMILGLVGGLFVIIHSFYF